MHHLRGIVRRASDGAPVDGVRIECFGPSGKRFASASRAITGREGAFDLFVKSSASGRVTLPKVVQVLDRKGKTLAEVPIPKDNAEGIEVSIDDAVLAKAGLGAPAGRTVLRAGVVALVRAKADDLRADGDDARASLSHRVSDAITALPPLATDTDLVSLAADVLRGRVASYAAFDEALDRLDEWNTAAFGPNVAVSRDIAAALLKDSDERAPHAHHRDTDAPIDTQALYTVIGAAMRVAGDDPVRTIRNIGVVARQLCPIRETVGLHAAARLSEQLGRLDAFADRASVIAEDWGPSPGPDDRPGRPFPRGGPDWPRPIPGCPDGNPWPPPSLVGRPVLPALPIPGAAEKCHDWLRQFGVFARERTYTISDIAPQDACVGERVTITGSNLVFEQSHTFVTFAGSAPGSRVEGRVVGAPTATQITVEVPFGATCGPVELASVDSTVEICGEMYELFHGPRVPGHFAGGMPRISGLRVNGVAPDSTGVVPQCMSGDRSLLVSWSQCGIVTNVNIAIEGGGERPIAYVRAGSPEATFSVGADAPAEAVYSVRVRLTGRCGTAEASLRVPTRKRLLGAEDQVEWIDDDFVNFHRNEQRHDVESFTPNSLLQLRSAVIRAEDAREQVGVTGSRCSYTDCVVPTGTDLMIRMEALQRWLNLDTTQFNGGTAAWRGHGADRQPLVSGLFPGTAAVSLAGVLRRNNESILSDEARRAYQEFIDITDVNGRLVYVEAGMLVEELNAMLDHHDPPLALATMGAGNHQTLSGAINTGTHGSTWRLPPLADFVRAIHLVGTNGEQWWLEPSSRPITIATEMRAAALDSRLGLAPCTRIRYDDSLFYTALISAGCAGITYAYVIETVPQHYMRTEVQELSWDDAKRHVLAELRSPTPASWYTEVIVRPSRNAVLNERFLSHAPPPSTPPPDPDLFDQAAQIAEAIAGIVVGLAAVSAAVYVEVLEAYAELLALAGQPWNWDEYDDVLERFTILGDYFEALADFAAIAASGGDNQAIADALPNLVELLWQITPLGIGAGQEIIDQIQLMQTLDFAKVPHVAKSFTALTQQPEGAPSDVPRHERYLPTQRIMRSSEYAFTLDRGIAFVEHLLSETDRLGDGDDAFILSINVRFTAPTRALIGMQQFAPVSCLVELFTMAGLDGNAGLDEAFDRLVRTYGGAPHWGQLHPLDLDWQAIFGPKLTAWRNAMAVFADGSDTFRHRFATSRGLLR